MGNTDVGHALFGVFGIVVLALALRVVVRSPTVNGIAWSLAVPAVVLSLIAAVGGQTQWLRFAQLFEAELYFYAAAGLIEYMLADHRMMLDELLAAGAVFTLLAWAFAFVYRSGRPGIGEVFRRRRCRATAQLVGVAVLEFQFALQRRPQRHRAAHRARALAMIVMLDGVMYIAVVVSRLLGLTVMRQRNALKFLVVRSISSAAPSI